MMLDYFLETVLWLVGFILLSAGWGKFKNLSNFKQNLTDSFKLSPNMSHIVAPALIVIEWILAGFIITNSIYSYVAMIIALALFSFFTLLLTYHWLKDARVKCNCFGEDDRPVSGLDLLRNAVIILCLIFYLTNNGLSHTQELKASILIAGIALLLSIVVIHLHNVVALLMSSQGRS